MNKDQLPEEPRKTAPAGEDTEATPVPAAGETPANDKAAEPANDTAATVDTADTDGDKNELDETPDNEANIRVKKDRRRLRYGGMATAMTAIVVAAVVLVNVLAGALYDRFPLSLDLTRDKLYTLTDESVEFAESIDKNVQITVFADEDIFDNPSTGDDSLNTIFKQIAETLRQYNTRTDGRVTTQYLDLNEDPTLATQYNYELATGDILVRCTDNNREQLISYTDLFTYETSMNYTTYSYEYTYTSTVERTLATTLMKVVSEDTPVVTLLTGHGEDSSTMTALQTVLDANNYDVETVDFTTAQEFDEKSVMAVIAGATVDFSDEELDRLADWLENDGKRGRSLYVLINYSATLPSLYEYLEVNYGLEVTDNLIVESEAGRIYGSSYGSSYVSPYNAYADVASTDYTGDLAGKLVLSPLTRQIITHKDNDTSNALFNVDVVTFPETAQLLSLSTVMENEGDSDIEPVSADEYPLTGLAYAVNWNTDSDNNTLDTFVMVSGSSMLFSDSAMNVSTANNEALLLALSNGFTGNKVSTNISTRPLEKTALEFTGGQGYALFWTFIVIVPVLLLVVCLVVFIRRKRL